MKYKKGDKVVVEVDKVGFNITGNQLLIFDPDNDVGLSADNELVLGKLEDFIPAEEKIVMTAEEKEEFDKLKKTYKSLYWAFIDITKKRSSLYDRLFCNNDYKDNNKAQLDFARAWDKPSRIEVEKEEKKYYVHLLENDSYGYLNQNVSTKEYFISTKEESDQYKTKFTKSKIEKMHFDNFKITNKALEEVEDE